MKHVVFILLAVVPFLLRAQERPALSPNPARDRTYHVVHYKLNIEIDEHEKSCKGEAALTVVPLRPELAVLDIDAAEMKVEKVRMAGQSLEFRHHGETLSVDLGKAYGLKDTLTVAVTYTVIAPKEGLYFITPDSGYVKEQMQVWSNGETTENHHWFPCYDYPNDMSTSEIYVTVNDKWTVISNGKLVDVKKDAKRRKATFHWYEGKPHVSYLISLVAGEYAEVKDSWGTIPLSFFVYKHQRDDALRSFAKSSKIMEFYSSKIGIPYPWEKYSQSVVQDYIVGGQENVSATTLTDVTIHDARAHLDYTSDGLIAHEMAHQWFGDLMTCRDWSHLWLNEGFATYFEVLFEEYDRGTDVAMKTIYDNQLNVVSSDVGEKRRPTVYNAYADPNILFTNRIYGKGACVLNMMRSVLGDELFWKAIRYYARTNASRPVETNDLKIAVEEATGYNLEWFFAEWVYGAGYPEFDITSSWDNAARAVNVKVRQVQKTDSLTGIFTMPVDIEVWVHDVPQSYRVTIGGGDTTFAFPAYQQPQLVIFDKGSRILKKASFKKSADEWIFQLAHAEYGVDRMAAIEELRWQVDSARVNAALTAAAVDDRFADVRLQAVFALDDAKRSDVSETLMKTYGDSDARVRAASVTGLKNYHDEKILELLRHAFDKDSSYAVASGAMNSLMKADSTNAMTYATNGLKRDSYRETIRITALRGLAEIHDDAAYRMVKDQTRYGISRQVRLTALDLLSRKWKEREDLVPFVITLTADPSIHMRRAAADVLGNSGSPTALAPLRHLAESETDARIVKIAQDGIEKLTKVQKEKNAH